MTRRLLACATVIWLCLPALSFAQSPTAMLSGVVTDEHGGRVVGAGATIENLETTWQRTTTTDAKGMFRFPVVHPGTYQLTVRMRGFTTAVVPNIALAVSQEATCDITLRVGPIEQTVSVTANRDTLFEPGRATLGRTISREEIDHLPFAGRGIGTIATLATLVPGVLTDVVTTITGVATAGQRGDSNNFLIDGLSMDDPLNAALRGTLPLDAIREFTVLTNNVPAEYGQATGLVVNAATRSGTNVISSRGYLFVQNGRWAATPADLRLTDPLGRKPELEQHVLGGHFSGPIRRDRAFIFAAAEQVWRDSIYAFTGSTAAFEEFRAGQPQALPVATTLPKLFARGDLRLGENHVLTLRYRSSRSSVTNALRERKSAPERGHDLFDDVVDAAFSTTHALTPGLVVETRGQFARRDIRFDVDRGDLCTGCVAENRPGILLGKPPNAPQERIDDRWQFTAAVTWVFSRFGDHVLKAGTDSSSIVDRGEFAPDKSGTFIFDRDASFDPSVRTTYPFRYTRNEGAQSYELRQRLFSAFVQDEWKPADQLSIGIGVRVDGERVESAAARTNVAPRFRLAFDPWSRGRVSLRGGYGRYYDQMLLTVVRDAYAGQVGLVVDNPGYPDPFDSSLRGPARVRRNETALSPDLRTPYADQLTLGLQGRIGAATIATLDAVGSRGRDLLIGRDLNYPDLSRPDDITPRLAPTLRQVVIAESRASSWYRALQIGVQTRLESVDISAAYTWSDSQNDTDGPRSFPQDQRNYGDNRGPSPNDSRHRLGIGAHASLPWGLRLAAVVNARSGLPYTAVLTSDANGDGVLNDRRPGVGRNPYRGTAFAQTDIRLSKTVAVGSARIEWLLEVFNATNRTNWIRFDGVDDDLGLRLGQPLESGPPRQFQAGVRASF